MLWPRVALSAIPPTRDAPTIGEADLQHILYPRPGVGFHQALDPDERLDLRVETVAHELELAVGGYKADGAVVFKPRQAHALVEFDVLHLDGLAARGAARRLEHDLVIEAESQLGHAAQVTLHLDRAENLRPQDIARCRYEEIQRFDHIQEDFVLAIADAFASPRDSVGNGDGGSGLDFEFV